MVNLWELDEFKPPQFLGFIRAIPEPLGYRGSTWLPNETVFDLSFEYLLGASSRPVMAHIMGFDAEAPISGRGGRGEKVSGELPPIKRKRRIGEKAIIRFMSPRAGLPDAVTAIDSVYEDAADLVDAIQARVEWLRLQALSEDTVVYDEGGVTFAFDFGIPDEQQFSFGATSVTDGTGATVSELSQTWLDRANSNPVEDLAHICDMVQQRTGRRPRTFVTSPEMSRVYATNAEIKAMAGVEANRRLTAAELGALWDEYELPTIVPYGVVMDKENEDGSFSQVRPLASNKGFLLPDGFGADNKTLWGPTAESRVLFGTPLAANAPGVWAETYSTTEPPAEWVKAAAVAFPTMPGANQIAQVEFAPAT